MPPLSHNFFFFCASFNQQTIQSSLVCVRERLKYTQQADTSLSPMGCAQSKCAGGGGGGTAAVERGYAHHDGFRVVGRREENNKLMPRTDSSLTARPSQHEAPACALSTVSYGSLAEHRKSASRGGSIEPPRAEDVGPEEEEEGGGEPAESSDNNGGGVGYHQTAAVRLFEFFMTAPEVKFCAFISSLPRKQSPNREHARAFALP